MKRRILTTGLDELQVFQRLTLGTREDLGGIRADLIGLVDALRRQGFAEAVQRNDKRGDPILTVGAIRPTIQARFGRARLEHFLRSEALHRDPRGVWRRSEALFPVIPPLLGLHQEDPVRTYCDRLAVHVDFVAKISQSTLDRIASGRLKPRLWPQGHGLAPSGVSFGSAPHPLVRLYNKSLQIHGKSTKQWIRTFWSGYQGPDAWRLELNFTPERMRRAGITRITGEAVTSHVREVLQEQVRLERKIRGQDAVKLDPIWELLLTAEFTMPWESGHGPYVPAPITASEQARLRGKAGAVLGALRDVLAATGVVYTDALDSMAMACHQLAALYPRLWDLNEEVLAKRRERGLHEPLIRHVGPCPLCEPRIVNLMPPFDEDPDDGDDNDEPEAPWVEPVRC